MIDRFLIKQLASIKKYFSINILFSIPLAVLAITQALLISSVIDSVFLKQVSITKLGNVLLILFFVFLIRPFLQGVFQWFNRKQTTLAKIELRSKLIAMADELENLEDDQRPITGLLTTLASEGIESTDAYFSDFLPHFIYMLINTVILLSFTFYLDLISGGIMLVTAPLIPIFMILIGKNAEGENKKQWLTLKRMNGHLLDLLKGMPTLRYFQKEIQQEQNVAKISESYRKQTLSLMKITFLSALALELCTTISTAVIAVSLGLRLLYGQIIFLPALTVLLLTPEFFQPLRQLGLKFHSSLNAKNIANQFKTIIEAYTQKKTSASSDTSTMAPYNNKPNLAPLFNLNAINFSYNNALPLFTNLSLIIPQGQIFGIAGKSGIGKTTLLKILLNEISPSSGTIKYKSKNLSEMDENDIINHIAYMPQKSKLLQGTILYNLKLDAPEISDDTLMHYCHLTGLTEVINRFPLGLMTLVGEGHQSLSGGEKQLIALTRACLRETELIILDEPTSSLDIVSEKQVHMALNRISYMRTLIIATHSLSTLSLCQEILDLDGGAYENI